MSAFTFEVVRPGKVSVVADVQTLSDDRQIWCHVEALALRLPNSDGAFIRVKNCEGKIIIRAGVATSLASVGRCAHQDCPLKQELNRRLLGASVAIH